MNDQFTPPEYLDFCKDKYRIECVIGEGTFSTVYKATCLNTGYVVAIKAITKTSAPGRILEELNMLKQLNGENNCIKLIGVIRNKDQILVVLPMIVSVDFKDLISNFTPIDIKKYMYSLITAVKHMHDSSIIHRDLKPSNFLYNLESETGYLIDFGLAQYEKPRAVVAERPVAPVLLFNSIVVPSKPPGFYERDTRPQMKAPRAGTRGFRAPEVLFRNVNQTKALDMWSVGVIYLCILTAQYPFFLSTEDIDGLVEIAMVYGHSEMRKAARFYGRLWKCNLVTVKEERIPFETLIAQLNPLVDISGPGIDLLNRLLELISDRRITAAEALEHDYFK